VPKRTIRRMRPTLIRGTVPATAKTCVLLRKAGGVRHALACIFRWVVAFSRPTWYSMAKILSWSSLGAAAVGSGNPIFFCHLTTGT
jgi:hypothetical protein